MIEIQISSVERKKIESLHKEYTKKIIVGRLEKILEDKRYCAFLKKLFGHTERDREKQLVYFWKK